MNLELKQKRVLVMGASAGIGKAIASAFIEEEARVAICARNIEKLEKTAKEIEASISIACDLSIKDSARTLLKKVIEKFGGIDVVVVNTGGPPKGSFEEISVKDWEIQFQNLWLSTVESIQEALPVMKEQRWGRIIIVTSVAAKEAMSGLLISNGLRAGLMGLAKTISNEVASHNITINLILPGFTNTERLQQLKLTEQEIRSKVPSGRLGEPKELGYLATFLASNKASYITGQAIAVDGGYLKGF